MRNGLLRHKIELQAASTTTQDFDHTRTWTTYATVMGRKHEPRGKEVDTGLQLQGEMTHKFEVRYRDDISVKHRVLWRDRTFDIFAVENPDGRRKRMILRCTEHRSDGD
ncbi:MAG: phage head closure protein [Pseudomonadota bacterium]